MGKFKVGNPKQSDQKMVQIDQNQVDMQSAMQSVLDRHSDLFKRLADLEAKEKLLNLPTLVEIPCQCSTLNLEPKVVTETVYIQDESPKIDKRARKHSLLLSKKLQALENKEPEIQVVEKLIPQEKQIVTEIKTVETIKLVPVTEKKVWVCLGLAVILNIVALIIK